MTPTTAGLSSLEDIVITRARIAAERAHRVQLLIQRGRLKQLCAELQGLCSDDSARPDAARPAHLENAAQLEAIESRLQAIDAALHRLREGQFGVCVDCDDVIPLERLEARPDADLCMPCCEQGRSK